MPALTLHALFNPGADGIFSLDCRIARSDRVYCVSLSFDGRLVAVRAEPIRPGPRFIQQRHCPCRCPIFRTQPAQPRTRVYCVSLRLVVVRSRQIGLQQLYQIRDTMAHGSVTPWRHALAQL